MNKNSTTEKQPVKEKGKAARGRPKGKKTIQTVPEDSENETIETQQKGKRGTRRDNVRSKPSATNATGNIYEN